MKKVTAIILTGILTLGVLTGCQSNSKAEEKGSSEDAKTIKVAASATPHAEILAAAKPILAEQGWNLEVTEFDDYVLPNDALADGSLDANYFQHIPYLEETVKEKGYDLTYCAKVHIEPMGIYSNSVKLRKKCITLVNHCVIYNRTPDKAKEQRKKGNVWGLKKRRDGRNKNGKNWRIYIGIIKRV